MSITKHGNTILDTDDQPIETLTTTHTESITPIKDVTVKYIDDASSNTPSKFGGTTTPVTESKFAIYISHGK